MNLTVRDWLAIGYVVDYMLWMLAFAFLIAGIVEASRWLLVRWREKGVDIGR